MRACGFGGIVLSHGIVHDHALRVTTAESDGLDRDSGDGMILPVQATSSQVSRVGPVKGHSILHASGLDLSQHCSVSFFGLRNDQVRLELRFQVDPVGGSQDRDVVGLAIASSSEKETGDSLLGSKLHHLDLLIKRRRVSGDRAELMEALLRFGFIELGSPVD